MKKTLSLKEPKEFQRVLNKGKWYGGNLVSTYILSNNIEANIANTNFIGLAIGKKVGKATKRNRVKRIIRAAYLNLEDKISSGYSFVFVWRAKAKYEDVTFVGVKRDLERAFIKAGLLNIEEG